jgi:drug/metabolite transporter (DMT)-like permease
VQRAGIHVALFAVVLMWGMVFIGIHELLPYIDAIQLVVIRFSMISLIFLAVFAAVPATRPRLTARELPWLGFVGLLGVPGSQLTVVNGQRYLSPPLVSLMVTTSPAWAALISAFVLKERFGKRQLAGFAIALAGTAIVILAGTGKGTELTVDNPWGAALTLTSPLCWAFYTVLSKPLTERFNPVTVAGVTIIAGTLGMFPLYPHAVAGLGEIPAAGWGWMVYLAVGGTTIPYLIWFRALNQLTASQTAAYMYGIPFAALVWAWLILDSIPTPVALLGGGVVIAGVALTQFGAMQQRRAALRALSPEVG